MEVMGLGDLGKQADYRKGLKTSSPLESICESDSHSDTLSKELTTLGDKDAS